MAGLIDVIKRYSIRHDAKIKKICEPLAQCLGIPYFTYYCIDEQGRFGTISNATEFIEYYYSQRLYESNPFMAHPDLFQSGQMLTPCSLDPDQQSELAKRFDADHLFIDLSCESGKMEGFIFSNHGLNPQSGWQYVSQLNLLTKFSRYFKREAKTLIGRMLADQFNMKTARGQSFLEAPPQLPLTVPNPMINTYLKVVTGLSKQELRCLELFKAGKSAQATAAIMGLSQRTVEHYFESIKNKLGCSSKWDLLSCF
ncbi:MAG: LuxR C-terminal-related transcriptional regulator [Chlamydiales bacterium]|nr:LuxR C-terminal-related transcriptional regulator [Chlamydiales bacterium]